MVVHPTEKVLPPLESLATPIRAVQIDDTSKPLPVHDGRTFSSELRMQTQRRRITSSLT